MVRAARFVSPIRAASFTFQTRAGMEMAGRDHLGYRRRGLTVRLSCSESDAMEGDDGGKDRGFSSTDSSSSVEEEGEHGVIVGAEGTFPVELRFLSRRGDDSSCVEEDDWVEGRMEASREGASAGNRGHVLNWEGSISRVDRGGRPDRVTRGPEGKVEDDDTLGLGSWLADFGMLVSAGSGLGGGEDPLVGWGWVSQQGGFVGERRYFTGAPDCGHSVVGTNYTEAKEGSRVELRNVSGRRNAAEALREPCKPADDISNAGFGWNPIKEATTMEKGIEAAGNTTLSPSIMMTRGRGDYGGFDSGGSPRAFVCGNNEAPDHIGFLDKLRRVSSGRMYRKARKLELAVRAAGDELYGSSDRLSTLSANVASKQCTPPGMSGVRVAAAVKEAESLREAPKTEREREGRRLEWTEDIRRAAKGVREAERAVKEDAKLLADASIRATIPSDLSACRAEMAAAGERLHAGNIMDEVTSAALLRDANSSLDECSDHVQRRVKVPSQRRACGGGMIAADDDDDDKRLVASCKAKVAAFMALSTEQRQQGQPPQRVDPDRGQAERLLTQARALWRTISGDGGTRRLSTGQTEWFGDGHVRETLLEAKVDGSKGAEARGRMLSNSRAIDRQEPGTWFLLPLLTQTLSPG